MRIAFVFNRKRDDSPAQAEFDTPETICASSPDVRPTTTGRRWALLSLLTTKTDVVSSSRTMAPLGTIRTFER